MNYISVEEVQTIIRGLSLNLFLQARSLEGEQELFNVVLPELVNAASVNGSPQEFIHLILGVHGLLNTAAATR